MAQTMKKSILLAIASGVIILILLVSLIIVLWTRVDGNQAKIEEHTTAIGLKAAASDLKAVETNLASLTATSATNAGKITSLTSTSVKNSAEILSNTGKITALTSTSATHNTGILSNADKITALTSTSAMNSGAISSNQDKITALTSAISSNQDKITALTSAISSNQDKITALTSAISSNQDKITALTSAISSNQDKITALTSAISSNQDKITALTSAISSNQDKITALTIAISSNQDKIADLDVTGVLNRKNKSIGLTDTDQPILEFKAPQYYYATATHEIRGYANTKPVGKFTEIPGTKKELKSESKGEFNIEDTEKYLLKKYATDDYPIIWAKREKTHLQNADQLKSYKWNASVNPGEKREIIPASEEYVTWIINPLT